MRVAVIGAGGLGGYFGGRLAAAGEDVRFVARGRHLDAMRATGLRVESPLGDLTLPPTATLATDDPATIGPCDAVLFTVKSYDTEAAAERLRPLLAEDTAAISLQNGIDNEDRLAAVIGPEHVIGGVAYIWSGIVEPGLVRHTGGPARLILGEMDGRPSERLDAIVGACRHAGIDAEATSAIVVELWTKYAFICAQAGLTAATRRPIGAIRESPRAWALFGGVLSEAVAVGRAEGVPLPPDLVEVLEDRASSLAPDLTSSLANDLVAGHHTELEGLLGELVRRAEVAGVPAPASTAIYAILAPQSIAADHHATT